MDRAHDQLATGRELTIIDTFSRSSPALEPRFTFHGADVVEMLDISGRQVGLPATIWVDHGEFVSRDLDLRAYQRGVTLDFFRPGKPTDYAFIEAFNGRLRAEYVNALVPEPFGRVQKIGGLAQGTRTRNARMGQSAQRRDYHAESTWQHQPAIVMKPYKSNRRAIQSSALGQSIWVFPIQTKCAFLDASPGQSLRE